MQFVDAKYVEWPVIVCRGVTVRELSRMCTKCRRNTFDLTHVNSFIFFLASKPMHLSHTISINVRVLLLAFCLECCARRRP